MCPRVMAVVEDDLAIDQNEADSRAVLERLEVGGMVDDCGRVEEGHVSR